MDSDAFWKIQLGTLDDHVSNFFSDGTVSNVSWFASSERELVFVDSEKCSDLLYNETEINIWMNDTNPEKVTLTLTSVRASNNLLGHVGEELWDASKLMCAYIAKSDTFLSVRGKRVLELGAGCGLVGMVSVLFGASSVIVTDHSPRVLRNLYSNLSRNKEVMRQANTDAILRCADLNWSEFCSDDLRKVDWMRDRSDLSLYHNYCIQCQSTSCTKNRKSSCISNDSLTMTQREIRQSQIDMIIGTALIYSMEGAFTCADTIHFFFQNNQLNEVWIIQKISRPGFDRFLLRLEYFGYNCELQRVSDEIFQDAKHFWNLAETFNHDFYLCKIYLKRRD